MFSLGAKQGSSMKPSLTLKNRSLKNSVKSPTSPAPEQHYAPLGKMLSLTCFLVNDVILYFLFTTLVHNGMILKEFGFFQKAFSKTSTSNFRHKFLINVRILKFACPL